MKTEASTRRALEKCIFGRRLVCLLFVFLREGLKADLEMLAERDRCGMMSFLYLRPVRLQASCMPEPPGAKMDHSDGNAT